MALAVESGVDRSGAPGPRPPPDRWRSGAAIWRLACTPTAGSTTDHDVGEGLAGRAERDAGQPTYAGRDRVHATGSWGDGGVGSAADAVPIIGEPWPHGRRSRRVRPRGFTVEVENAAEATSRAARAGRGSRSRRSAPVGVVLRHAARRGGPGRWLVAAGRSLGSRARAESARIGDGTDEELFSGGMSYLETNEAAYPGPARPRVGGRVVEVGEGVDASWMDARVTGDTMLGDGTCHLCRSGRQHLCRDRYEIGLRRGWPGALAERLPVPGARAPPPPRRGGPAARGARRTQWQRRPALRAADVRSGERLLVFGPGAIGFLVALFARADGVEVHLVGRSERSRAFATSLGSSTCGPTTRSPISATTRPSTRPARRTYRPARSSSWSPAGACP